jgi:hypothetical protein
MTATEQLFRAITELEAEQPFQPEAVARLTGHKLRPVLAESTPYYVMLRSDARAPGPFLAVELRYPAAASENPNGFLILSVSPALCVTRADVLDRFGADAETSLPMPEMPPNSPIYLVYPRPWGYLRFGFEPTGRECLTTVVFDPTEVAEPEAEEAVEEDATSAEDGAGRSEPPDPRASAHSG